MSVERGRAQRSNVAIAIAVFAALIGLVHLTQAVTGMRGDGDPRMLTLEHLDVTIFSFVAAYAIWQGKRWAPWALAVAGASVAVLIVSLGPLLDLNSMAQRGLWGGAASIAIFYALGVWYLSRR